jgi:acyl carrier protein
MDYRALVAASLTDIGVEFDRVKEIEAGAMIYGDTGVLDSVYLVALIAALEERLAVAQGAPVNLFAERDFALVDEFRDLRTLISFLQGRGTGNAAVGEPRRGIKG